MLWLWYSLLVSLYSTLDINFVFSTNMVILVLDLISLSHRCWKGGWHEKRDIFSHSDLFLTYLSALCTSLLVCPVDVSNSTWTSTNLFLYVISLLPQSINLSIWFNTVHSSVIFFHIQSIIKFMKSISISPFITWPNILLQPSSLGLHVKSLWSLNHSSHV